MGRKKWKVSNCDKDVAASIAESCGIAPFTAYILCLRGYTDEYAVDSFLYDAEILDPYILPDMDKAVVAIKEAITCGKRITIFGDYDTDGVTATALLYMYLKSKEANVDFYIPDRSLEGYGLSEDAIYSLKENGTEFIITVDNGISAVKEVKLAKDLGIEMVITDHHRPADILPEALAVIDPYREDYEGEFKEWAGVGIAFKLACALEDGDDEKILSDYGDIIALGTIADVVPLKGENRVLVKRGIERINANKSVGLSALKEAAAVRGRVNSTSVAFILAPRLNAAGRMGSAERALELLVTDSKDEAKVLSDEICLANEIRKKEESDIEAAVLAQIAENPSIGYSRVIVASGENWHQGVIGIVASRICSMFGKPAIIISKDNGIAKGSGRSIAGFSLYEALSEVKDVLLKFGGHTLAAGMSLPVEDIELFRDRINEYAENKEPDFPTLKLDCKLNPATLSLELLKSLTVLEPCGVENSQPLFGLYNMQITGIQSVGNGRHLKLNLKRGNSNMTAMYFSMPITKFMFVADDYVDLAVKLDKNEYMGETKLSVHIKSVRFAGADDDEVFNCRFLYEKFKRGEKLSCDEVEKLRPERDLQEKLYRYIREKGVCFANAEMLCKRLSLETDKIAAIEVALDVFYEMSLIEYTQDKMKVSPTNGVRADLNNSRILLSLGKREA